jgi:uncharacterized membrane protein YozB (DUF420 family)
MREFGSGFLGTNASALSDISLLLAIAVAILLTIGFIMAARNNIRAHRWFQTAAVLLNIAQVIIVMLPPFFRFVAPTLAANPGDPSVRTTGIHAFFGIIALVYGTYVMLTGNEILPEALRFKNYKPFMRAAYALYIIATLIGVGVYFAAYT